MRFPRVLPTGGTAKIAHTIPERRDQIAHRKARGSRGGRPPAFDADVYLHRNTVERSFNRFKHWRGIATGYDRYALTYLGGALDSTASKRSSTTFRHDMPQLERRILRRRGGVGVGLILPDMGWEEALGGEPAGVLDPPRATPHRRHAGSSTDKRLDIQGLRAVAVVAVVVNHLTGHPKGGFVGVDVFFVISGYLISQHLLREHARLGRISLLSFYKRRIRRLFPAALTITLLTVLAAHQIFTTARYTQTVRDAVWATLFSANWRFVQSSTDYFQATGPVSPLQHYWSLSVEEQFYVVWPIALLIALTITAKLVSKRRAGLIAGIVVASTLTTVSLYLAFQQTANEPVVAYFSTFSRGWELGLGAILAVLAPYMRGGRTAITALSWLGLAATGLSFFVVSGQAGFPAPAGLLPCLGSAAVIIAHTASVNATNPILTNQVATYLGDISYSIYVVHFPVIIFADALVRYRATYYYVAVPLIMLGISMLLFHVIENPIRESNWLKSRSQRTDRDDREHAYPWAAKAAMIGSGLAVFGLVVATVAAPANPAAGQYQAILEAESTAAPSTTAPSATLPQLRQLNSPSPSPLRQLKSQIRKALLATTWPPLKPSFDTVLSGPEVSPDIQACGAIDLAPASQCTWGNALAKHTIYLAGDSTSVGYAVTFRAMVAGLTDWKIRSVGAFGCAFSDAAYKAALKPGGCDHHNQQVVSEIRSTRPDLVVIANLGIGPPLLSSMNGEIQQITTYTGTVVLLAPPPPSKDPRVCYTRASSPTDCVGAVSGIWESYFADEERLASQIHGVFIDSSAWFCDGGYCPSFVDGVPTRLDQFHVTSAYAVRIAPVILEAFKDKGLFG